MSCFLEQINACFKLIQKGDPLFKLFNKTRFDFVYLSLGSKKNEDKVSLKIFRYIRDKRVASKFHIVNTSCRYITFNKKRNALYVGKIDNYHKKTKSKSSSTSLFSFFAFSI